MTAKNDRDTGGRIKRLIRHAAVYGLGSVAARLAGFLLLPVYTRVLTEDQLGVVYLMNIVSALLGTVLGFGFSSAILRYYLATDDPDERRSIITSGYVFLSLVALGTVSVAALFREPIALLITGNPEHATLVAIALGTTFFEVGLHIPLALFRANELSTRFVVTSLTRFVGTVTMAILLVVVWEKEVLGVLLATMIGSGVVYLALSPYVAKNVRGAVSAKWVRTLFGFGFPLMLATVGSFIIDTSDLWLLRTLRGDMDEVGVYGTIYRLAKITHVCLIQPFILAWPAILFSTREPEAQRNLCRQTLTYVTVLIALAALVVTQLREPIIAVWVTENFLSAAIVLPLVLYSFVFLLPYFVLNSGASLSEKPKLVTVALFFAVTVNIGGNLLLIPPYGMLGAAIATLLAYMVQAVAMWILSQRAFPIPYDLRRVGVIIAGSALAAAGGAWCEGLGAAPWVTRPAGVALFLSLLAAIATDNERRFLARALKGDLRIGTLKW